MQVMFTNWKTLYKISFLHLSRAIFHSLARISYNNLMDCYEKLKNNLKKLRSQNSETQKQVSESTGIARSNLARYETGENIPPLDSLIILSKYFNVTIDELLNDTF